ncbi:hypothetical protein AKUH3B110M_02890 [Apilactobacillus kunkeei]|uniref:DUF3899 domain-containing protein n=1 Tax=Apilactobacillus kunkeei TaxID=148814 RepID=UPI00200A6417|nr:DUF3899 domain-containing protein [Apilactobacillus kunkeei]MCK8634242.1 DUF3899 domain-containing protein [Apilactobacillus kunkeei]CAI2566626.1 hypothetical protein AKUG0802_02880 [Apilactobacillus kunkeei]CAI2567123.1 hypothetical protein AKUG0804_02900 [Apilactobacillus kunkeei]CAI2567223.1 hypothetical protein AKUG0103_02890 [Apilactobacillus kunkeei]CAI2567278.1 hypothetical protein AKUG0405_02890 [Apilactobacillus kunkeei]
MNKPKKLGLLIALVGIVVALIAMVFKISAITISNYLFLIGLLFTVIGLIGVLSKGHLFTGWRIFHRKDDDERFENEKIPANKIGGIKNAKIVVRPFAQLTLIIGIIWIAFAIIITL